MNKTLIPLKCPNCGLVAKAEMRNMLSKFLIYTCPKCKSHVAFYNNKVNVISTSLLKRLMNKGKLRCCGNVSFPNISFKKRPITKDDILNLKILLEMETDSAKIIEML